MGQLEQILRPEQLVGLLALIAPDDATKDATESPKALEAAKEEPKPEDKTKITVHHLRHFKSKLSPDKYATLTELLLDAKRPPETSESADVDEPIAAVVVQESPADAAPVEP